MHIIKLKNEDILLEEISKGNEIAFKTIYDNYFNKLSTYIYKLCKSKDATEEIVNDVFLKIWTSKSDLSIVYSFEAYLFTMARNKAIDYLRKLAKNTHLISELTDQIKNVHNDVEEKLDAEALRMLIDQALSQLSDQKKKIFKMSKEDGYSHDEIAANMQLSKSTVKNHLSETLKHLKKQIDPESDKGLLLLVLLVNLLD
ncbi:RNA polymerase sigma-70 factor [Pedobacter sp. ASV1-7]|uniref:RNA polymerase sigma factor n=1 Tax=Pedobacter sp. ASV1-7 TaxID=3145237 RepID=UPI0032E90295